MPARIDAFARQFILHKVRQLVGLGRRVGCTAGDIENELVANLCHRRPHYDPRQGAWTTFVRLVTDHHAATLVERWRRQPELVEIPEWDTPSARPQNGRTRQEHDQLRLDVHETVATLNESDQRICRSLMDHPNVTEAAQAAELSRPALYRRVAEIRNVFERRDLQKYLSKRRTPPNGRR